MNNYEQLMQEASQGNKKAFKELYSYAGSGDAKAQYYLALYYKEKKGVGPQEDLEMVDGADEFLDVLTTDGLYVTLDVSLEGNQYMHCLKLVKHDEIGGTYEVTNHGRFDKDVWLCNVVHYLFGEHPEFIYFNIK